MYQEMQGKVILICLYGEEVIDQPPVVFLETKHNFKAFYALYEFNSYLKRLDPASISKYLILSVI